MNAALVSQCVHPASPLLRGSSRSARSQGRAARAGFTLVELMVALTGGLFLSIVVFVLARDTTRFYQHETRLANATLAGLSGFERLSSDIARAGHLVSPNIGSDPRVCNRPAAGAGWPLRLQSLRSLVIDPGAGVTQVVGTELDRANVDPMRIELAGTLDATEELPIRTITPDATGGWDIFLQTGMPAMARLSALDVGGVVSQATLDAMFMAGGQGRAVRIVDKEGLEQYGVVVSTTAAPQPSVKLAPTPGLIFRTNAPNSPLCGFKGFNTGATINAINFVRYDIRRMSGVIPSNYGALFAAAASAPFEATRAELVRVELDPNGAEIQATLEIVAEYAVDLQFAPVSATSPTVLTIVPVAAGAVTTAFANTQLLRGVHVRLRVRSREADRTVDVEPALAADFYRIGLGAGGAGPFARVRTLQAHVPLRNHQGANW